MIAPRGTRLWCTTFRPVRFIALLATTWLVPLLTNLKAAPAQAVPASRFLNSPGVNSSISRRGQSLHETIEATRYLGIRWFRCGYEGSLPLEDLFELHDNQSWIAADPTSTRKVDGLFGKYGRT
ncbi:MAG: hypothetical protein RI897_3189 [Verrucomicrobiota bacterium]|jgi:hypothetical protein